MRVTPRHARLAHEARYVAATPDRSRLLLAGGDGSMTVLDGALRTEREGRLPSAAGALALSPKGDLLAVAAPDAVVIAEVAGPRVRDRAHRRWREYESGAVAFLPDGDHLLAIVPAGDEVLAEIVEVRSGLRLAGVRIEVPEPSGFQLIEHPTPGTWALWAGAGQDGQWTFWLRFDGKRLAVEELAPMAAREHGPVAFEPRGRELLVEVDGAIERFSLPALKLLGRIEPPADRDFAFAERCHYVGRGRALVTEVNSSRLFLLRLDAMTLDDEVVVAGHEARPAAERFPRVGAPDEPACTDLWYVTALPRAALLGVHGSPRGAQELTLLEGAPLFA